MATKYLSISTFTSSNFVELILFLSMTLACIFIVFPSIIVFFEHNKSVAEKKYKKKLLAQILLQKEIENEIEKNVQIEDEQKVT